MFTVALEKQPWGLFSSSDVTFVCIVWQYLKKSVSRRLSRLRNAHRLDFSHSIRCFVRHRDLRSFLLKCCHRKGLGIPCQNPPRPQTIESIMEPAFNIVGLFKPLSSRLFSLWTSALKLVAKCFCSLSVERRMCFGEWSWWAAEIKTGRKGWKLK